MYRIHVFKADQSPELSAEYCRNHANALAEYGCGGIASSKAAWMDNPNTYAIVVYDELGEMVSGVRLQFYLEDFPLPMEHALAEYDNRISEVVRKEVPGITGEMCGLWAARSIRSKGFGLIICRTATALAQRLGANSLFGLVSPHTYEMMLDFGYLRVPGVGRQGDFLYPTADYISTVMIMPDLASLEHTAAVHKDKMFSIRTAPVQQCYEGEERKFPVAYHLDTFITEAPQELKKAGVYA